MPPRRGSFVSTICSGNTRKFTSSSSSSFSFSFFSDFNSIIIIIVDDASSHRRGMHSILAHNFRYSSPCPPTCGIIAASSFSPLLFVVFLKFASFSASLYLNFRLQLFPRCSSPGVVSAPEPFPFVLALLSLTDSRFPSFAPAPSSSRCSFLRDFQRSRFLVQRFQQPRFVFYDSCLVFSFCANIFVSVSSAFRLSNFSSFRKLSRSRQIASAFERRRRRQEHRRF